MAVKYKIYQSKRNDRFEGRWYARAVHEGTVTTDDLADIMQDNCTVKRSDILAVISELVEVMRTQLQNSMRVKLDRFGTFKLGISTTSAEKAKDFTPGANIKGIHVLFQPELKIDAKGNAYRASSTERRCRRLCHTTSRRSPRQKRTYNRKHKSNVT